MLRQLTCSILYGKMSYGLKCGKWVLKVCGRCGVVRFYMFNNRICAFWKASVLNFFQLIKGLLDGCEYLLVAY